jgi:hypothetical protein
LHNFAKKISHFLKDKNQEWKNIRNCVNFRETFKIENVTRVFERSTKETSKKSDDIFFLILLAETTF